MNWKYQFGLRLSPKFLLDKYKELVTVEYRAVSYVDTQPCSYLINFIHLNKLIKICCRSILAKCHINNNRNEISHIIITSKMIGLFCQ